MMRHPMTRHWVTGDNPRAVRSSADRVHSGPRFLLPGSMSRVDGDGDCLAIIVNRVEHRASSGKCEEGKPCSSQ
jgi:hypothetical protein